MRFLLLFFIPLLFVTCSNNKEQLPAGIIPQDSLVSLLTEMEIIEAAFQKKLLKGNLIQKGKEQYQIIFAKYNINRDKLDNTLKYYENDPEALEAIFDKVIIELSKKESEIVK